MKMTDEQITNLRAQLKEIGDAEQSQREHLARLNHARETTAANLNALAGRRYQVEKWLEDDGVKTKAKPEASNGTPGKAPARRNRRKKETA